MKGAHKSKSESLAMLSSRHRNGAAQRMNPRHGAARISVEAYRDDPLYPRVTRAVAAQLAKGKVVAPVETLVAMELLTRENLENWRHGRVPYLERVITCNLTRLSRLLRILRFHAHDLNLVPSETVYMRWGKGRKQRLCFSKTGDPKVEQAYARHFVWPGKGPFHPPQPNSGLDSSNPDALHDAQ